MNYYNGTVPMNPEMKKKDFISEDTISYHVPRVHFCCTGEKDDFPSAFEWNDESVLVVKDKRVLKYDEITFSEVLVEDLDCKQSSWITGRLANISGYEHESIQDANVKKQYSIEEYDFGKFEKRKYKVVLEETTSITDSDYCNFKHYVDEESENNSVDYLT